MLQCLRQMSVVEKPLLLKDLNDKYNVTMFTTNVCGGKAVAV